MITNYISNAALIVVSMILQIATYVLMGLGAVYQNGTMTFGALVSLMLSLFVCKLVLDDVPN